MGWHGRFCAGNWRQGCEKLAQKIYETISQEKLLTIFCGFRLSRRGGGSGGMRSVESKLLESMPLTSQPTQPSPGTSLKCSVTEIGRKVKVLPRTFEWNNTIRVVWNSTFLWLPGSNKKSRTYERSEGTKRTHSRIMQWQLSNSFRRRTYKQRANYLMKNETFSRIFYEPPRSVFLSFLKTTKLEFLTINNFYIIASINGFIHA